MAVTFASPSHRAASSDLTVSVSPLGLVELSDEEFEVHGPRLNRYAQNWAFYLGHHWGYRREAGEPQLTFNYTRAMADFITNFCFGNGVTFRTPKATEAIVPDQLRRVWEVDNHKNSLFWEIPNIGGVTGDVFVKVAYEEPFQDPTGRLHPGRIRILPLNSSFCFPEWHPHDRSRLIRFKMKYRFWGTSMEGTRQVFTYTELMTEDIIEEYINDEMIDQRPNPLGVIPIAFTQNIPVSGSPWGLSDIQDIIGLNREYNEKATDISDIINYHSAPVTVITGAKVSQLEKGPKKVWGGLPKDAQVFNLELGTGLEGPLSYLEGIKRAMHEMTGVPEGALGQQQPISNTSGVALAIQYQPMMNRFNLKKTQYGKLFEKINELVMLTMALKEPEALIWNPLDDVPLKDGQMEALDPNDPITYISTAHFQPPLPVDKLIKLNEIQGKMAIGLESKRGALKDLGEEFPDDKMQELFDELVQDAKEQGALDLLKSQIMAAIMAVTGMVPDGAGGAVPSAGGSDVNSAGGGAAGGDESSGLLPGTGVAPTPEVAETMAEIVTLAYGTKLAQRRNPDNVDD